MHLCTRQMQAQCVQDVLQVSLEQIAAVTLVKVDKRHEQVPVLGHHLLLVLVQKTTTFTDIQDEMIQPLKRKANLVLGGSILRRPAVVSAVSSVSVVGVFIVFVLRREQ